MELRLRATRPEDYATLAGWIRDAKSCRRWAGARLAYPFNASDLPALLAHPGSRSYSLSDEKLTLYGFAQHWQNTPPEEHLGRIIVAPQARGKGLGRVLCQQLIDCACAASGASALTLRVYRDNAAALALYRSFGFLPCETESNADVLFMRRLNS